MQVRVFESPDMATGLKLVRKELGPDALILSTRTLKNGKLGLLGKPTIEITAAIDTGWSAQSPPQTQPPPRQTVKKNRKRQSKGRTQSQPFFETRVADEIQINYTEPASDQDEFDVRNLLTSAHPLVTDQQSEKTSLKEEVSELKNLLHVLAGQISEPVESPPPASTDGKAAQGSILLGERLRQLKASSDPLARILKHHGIDNDTAITISEFAKQQLETKDHKDSGKLRRFALKTIENLLEVKPPIFASDSGQRRIAFIGPTGVGKTTTLAKLAALYLLNHSNSVALITIDTYRIAAVEQLKVYGEIMHLPVDVVITPEQLRTAIERHADKELLLIDTAGRSPKDSLSIQELRSFMMPDLSIEKHLVLSAATRENELLDAIKLFEKVGIDRTIFTKVDECTKNGVILNVQLHNRAPLSYITNGQRVPEDLLQITSRSVAELIMSHHQDTENE